MKNETARHCEARSAEAIRPSKFASSSSVLLAMTERSGASLRGVQRRSNPTVQVCFVVLRPPRNDGTKRRVIARRAAPKQSDHPSLLRRPPSSSQWRNEALRHCEARSTEAIWPF